MLQSASVSEPKNQALSRENLWFQLPHYEYLVLTISNSYSEEEENPLSTTLKTTLCKFISDMYRYVMRVLNVRFHVPESLTSKHTSLLFCNYLLYLFLIKKRTTSTVESGKDRGNFNVAARLPLSRLCLHLRCSVYTNLHKYYRVHRISKGDLTFSSFQIVTVSYSQR